MPLLTTTTAQRIAAQIDAINSEAISYLRAQMQRAHDLANTAGEQQAVMDAFGTNAAQAVTVYATFRAALESINEAGSLPQPDLAVFTPQPDGTVIYTAPEPEPEPEQA